MANPVAFRPTVVATILALIYVALWIPSVILHEKVPRAPRGESEVLWGTNVTEAWWDLLTITKKYHPYASHANDEVRDYLIRRVEEILKGNGVEYGVEVEGEQEGFYVPKATAKGDNPPVTIFSDMLSNVTTGTVVTSIPGYCPLGHYFEGSNIYVYIRGTEDAPGPWWMQPVKPGKVYGGSGVLVNAHFDSVSTGFGATDDGMGVVSILQIIKHFTTDGNRPKNGLVAMFNNAEEDYLWGARAFGKSRLLPFIHTFLNLEGAGGGGRAMLFRSSDAEVTRPYAHSLHPFGNVIAADGFRSGAIQSQTDYIVLDGIYGQRGLDIAFYAPRARYHTNQDDARHASVDSVWHMLSASLVTLDGLTSDTSKTFTGLRRDGRIDLVQNGKGSDGAWFDIFGVVFMLFEHTGLFAVSVTLLVTGPILLFLISILLIRIDKYYLFTSDVRIHDVDEIHTIPIDGFRGFFRFPVALIFASALVAGAALLVAKVNPLIAYSSEYVVWTMQISLTFSSLWLILRGADAMRPTALQRAFGFFWLYIFGWFVLLAFCIAESRWKAVSGYPLVVMHGTVLISFAISLLELFSLPPKTYALHTHQLQRAIEHLNGSNPTGAENEESSALISPTPGEIDAQSIASEFPEYIATEETPLLGGGGPATNGLRSFRTTFASGYRRSVSAIVAKHREGSATPYGAEQAWSAKLVSWTWVLQALILGPVNLMLLAPTGLFLVSSMNQTGADGSSPLISYAVAGFFAILMAVPTIPFIHRVPARIPHLFMALFAASLAWNLLAFPFSAQARYKAYFQQSIDLDNSVSRVRLDGLEEYIRPIIASIPAAAGLPVLCAYGDARAGLVSCSFDTSERPGTFPRLIDGVNPIDKSIVSINVTRTVDARKATIELDAENSKACFLRFAKPVKSFKVLKGEEWDERFSPVPEEICQIKLWRRGWTGKWKVDVEWTKEAEMEVVETEELPWSRKKKSGVEGTVACIWADANTQGNIPVLDELLAFAPGWAAITKRTEGLVEGTRRFIL